jgi:BirA family biotin operon repressor/biotin-[acetyl-CoA-carboxylase] ligase
MKTLFIGQNSFHLHAVDSTNSYATDMLRQISLVDGTLFYTFNQLNGRGQRDNKWESEPDKNIALSVVIAPSFLSANKQFLLTQITSLALADLMAELLDKSAKVCVKWPNDIYINNKKIAGVLIENTLRDNIIQHSIIGVGINVNQETFTTTNNAVSLKQVAGKSFELMAVLEMFCKNLEAYYLQLKAVKMQEINQKYLSTLYRLNEWKNYSFDENINEGKIVGTTAEGKLIIELRDGSIRNFDLKEITFL